MIILGTQNKGKLSGLADERNTFYKLLITPDTDQL